jgi:DNA modification methylase
MPLSTGAQHAAPSDLREWPENPRTIDDVAFAQLKASLAADNELLEARPLIALPDGTVIAGNMRLRAAQEMGWELVPVHVVEADEQRAREIALRDNNQFGEWERSELSAMLAELTSAGTDPLALGFSSTDVDVLLGQIEHAAPPEPGPLPPEPITKAGDLIQLGAHRLICGDATDPDVIKDALALNRASCVWTDPPYGVDYTGKTPAALKIVGDEAVGTAALLTEAFAAIDVGLEPGAPIYVAHPAGALAVTFGFCFLEQGWRVHQGLVWVKNTMVLGHADYHYKHEPLILGYKPGPGRRGRGGKGWFGDNSQVSVLEYPKPAASKEHPTMKPVELVEHCLRNSSARETWVLDPFGGSGSTLLACERLGRQCAMLELDPRYCDVIVDRWESLTGDKAKR